MRIASVLVPALFLAASAAWADPAPSTPGAPPNPERTQPNPAAGDRAHFDRKDAEQASVDPAAQPNGKAFPSYHNEQATEANCYTIFGELRCDRVPNSPQRTTSR